MRKNKRKKIKNDINKINAAINMLNIIFIIITKKNRLKNCEK